MSDPKSSSFGLNRLPTSSRELRAIWISGSSWVHVLPVVMVWVRIVSFASAIVLSESEFAHAE